MKLSNSLLIIFLINLLYDASGHELKTGLTFVVDETASMGEEIEQLNNITDELFEAVLTSNTSQIDEVVLVTFNDPDVHLRTITNDRHEFKRALSGIRVHGGNDCPEMVMAGIQLALEKSKPYSQMYVLTDASAKDYYRFETVKSLCQQKSIQISFILTGKCGPFRNPDHQSYVMLAEATSGQIFTLLKNEVHKILYHIKESIKSKKTLLGRKEFTTVNENQLNFTVDSKIKDVVIAVSGFKSSLSIEGPQSVKANTVHQNLNPQEVVSTIMNKIIKIIPVPGVYTVTVNSKENTVMLITGSTNVVFQHGFSLYKAESINGTSIMPVPDVENCLSIQLTNDDRDVKLETVEVRDIHDHVLMIKPLEILDKEQQFYVTEKFTLPSIMFKIAVNGYINNKEPITRIGLTTIE